MDAFYAERNEVREQCGYYRNEKLRAWEGRMETLEALILDHLAKLIMNILFSDLSSSLW